MHTKDQQKIYDAIAAGSMHAAPSQSLTAADLIKSAEDEQFRNLIAADHAAEMEASVAADPAATPKLAPVTLGSRVYPNPDYVSDDYNLDLIKVLEAHDIPIPVRMNRIQHELSSAVNHSSMENGSNTPDWIIGEFLTTMIGALDRAILQRDKWYGRMNAPGQSSEPEPEGPNPNTTTETPK